jgi:hypothetical protein
MSSETLCHVALVRTDFSENVLFPSSGILRLIGFHSCIAMETLLLSRSIEEYYQWLKNTVFWGDFMVVSVKDVLWNFVPCSTNSN